jgi:hypothetical protein
MMKLQNRTEKLITENDWLPTITYEYSKGSVIPRSISINASKKEDEILMQKAIFYKPSEGAGVGSRGLSGLIAWEGVEYFSQLKTIAIMTVLYSYKIRRKITSEPPGPPFVDAGRW